MSWVETHGRKPKTGERLLYLKFRNGVESRQPYIAAKIRWDHNNDPWDVIACRRAEG